MFNANYVAYFDVILTELWREALGSYQDMVDGGHRHGGGGGQRALPGAGEIRRRDRLRGAADAAGGDVDVDAHRRTTKGAPVVQGEIRHVFIDPATKAKTPMPQNIRDALEPYLEA